MFRHCDSYRIRQTFIFKDIIHHCRNISLPHLAVDKINNKDLAFLFLERIIYFLKISRLFLLIEKSMYSQSILIIHNNLGEDVLSL